MNVYLAGPDVFLFNAVEIGKRKSDLCKTFGLMGHFPLDNKIDVNAIDASMQIFRANQKLMDGADAIIANLTPFRGPSADAGTIYELGYMAAKGKLCLGYSNDPTPYAERVTTFLPTDRHLAAGLADADGMTIEPFGLADNLMIVHALDLHGCPLVLPSSKPDDIWQDLTAFGECVRLAASRVLSAEPKFRSL